MNDIYGGRYERIQPKYEYIYSVLNDRKNKYSGMDGYKLRQLNELEEEKQKLQIIYVAAAADIKMLNSLHEAC